MSTAAILDGDSFAAYFGTDRFDIRAVRAGAPEFPFDGLRGPVHALRGEPVVVDLEEAGPWVAIHNLHYAAGEDGSEPMWAVVSLAAGTPGLRGQLVVNGLPENNGSVEASYSVGYRGMYPLPGFPGKPEIELRLSFANTGSRTAEFHE